ncbi:MAG: shikimate kinase [Ekhidna sp.]|nr:shikimate kinase [Ekhidna sp.]
MSQKVFLVGLPGAGKTTLGIQLADHLGIPFVDLDLEIEKHAKQSIRSIFSEKSEAYFRRLENRKLNDVIKELTTFVMATGGGTPCFFDNMKVMNAEGKTIFINTSIDKIKRRLQQDTVRPLMQTKTLEDLLEKREKQYLQADKTVTTKQGLFELFKKNSS